MDYGPGGVLKEPTPEEAAAGKQPEPARFALVALNYTNSEGYRPYVVLPPTGEVTFGRNPDAHNVQLDLVHNGAISRKKHFSVQTSPDGVAVADRGSSRGTKIIGNELPQPVEAAPEDEPDIEDTLRCPVGALGLSGAMEASSRTPEGSQNTYAFTPDQLRASIDTDERYTAIVAPYDEKLAELYQAYRSKKISERVYQAQAQPVRDQLERAVKPYLAQRLEAMSTDRKAGYLRPGALYRESTSVVTRDGKKIAWSIGGGRWSNEGVRLGQITLPELFPDWSGGHGGKANRKTRVNTTSAKHIVDLAAAIQAGNFGPEDEPVVISRDTVEEYNLPSQLQGIVRLYKVELGLHRMAADRLTKGFDAKANYDTLQGR